MNNPNKMVSYYSEHEISPVKQNITNLSNLFSCRSALLEQLAINSSNIKNKNILEVGPGSGYNALYFAKHIPSRYVMVEPNLTGIKDINDLFTKHYPNNNFIQIHQSFLSDFTAKSSEKFDLVWCENMLSGVSNPLDAVNDLTKLTADGGSLVITTMDEVSTFAENTRRLLCYAALGKIPNSPKDTETIIPLISPHLDNLKGMTRLYTDWVHDNIALPITAGYNILSIPSVLHNIDNKFVFASSSPRFYTDWRWYKNIPLSKESLNEVVANQYLRNINSFIDYRFYYPQVDLKLNLELINLCKQFRNAVVAIELSWDESLLQEAKKILVNLSKLIKTIAPHSLNAVEESSKVILKLKKNPKLLKELKYFGQFFGRNQQHIHLYSAD